MAITSVKSLRIVTPAHIPSAPADLELIAQLRNRLRWAELRIRVLEERLRQVRIEKYGASREKLSAGQMELFELAGSEAIQGRESQHPVKENSMKRTRRHPGRQELPGNLPRVERVVSCSQDQRICRRCGKETVVIGYEESSQLAANRGTANQWHGWFCGTPKTPSETPCPTK